MLKKERDFSGSWENYSPSSDMIHVLISAC